jgi:hypothetical protein
MKYLIACLLLLSFVAPTAAAQDTCDPNIAPATALLLEADTALANGDTDTALPLISQAIGVLEAIEAGCVEFAEPGAGNSRLNPVPFGQSKRHQMFDEVDASIEVTDFVDDAGELVAEANQFNDEADEGMKYVMVEFIYHCEFDPAQVCDAGRFDYNLVGLNGIVYEAASVAGDDFFLDRRILRRRTNNSEYRLHG